MTDMMSVVRRNIHDSCIKASRHQISTSVTMMDAAGGDQAKGYKGTVSYCHQQAFFAGMCQVWLVNAM